MTFPALGYDQEADFEEGRPTDADALNPDWDHTVPEGVGGFDSETDADGDLNDSTANPKLGTTHLRVTFDDATVAYGTISATGAGQTAATIDIWFDPNNFSLPNGKVVDIVDFADPGVTDAWIIRIIKSGADLQVVAVYRPDGAGDTNAATHTLSSSTEYVHIRMVFQTSSGAGNDDGFVHLLVDDGGTISTYSATGIDNDTRVYDEVRVGMHFTNAATFGGSYDIDEIRVSESVSPVWITEAAALAGSYGAAFTIEDQTDRYFELSNPTAETEVTVEAKIEPSGLTQATDDALTFINCNGELKVEVLYDGTNREVRATANLDSGTTATARYDITDAQHTIRAVLGISSGVGNNDGYLHLFSGGVLLESLTGLDNDTLSIDEVRGGVMDIDSGTSGVFFMDDMRWADDVILPQSNAGSLSPSGALTTLYTQFINLAGSISPSGAISTAITFAQSVAGSISPSGALATVKQRIFRAVVRFVETITQDAHYDDTVEGAARYDNEIEQDAHLG